MYKLILQIGGSFESVIYPYQWFHTTFGLYEFIVMPFGLTNARAKFNRMMERTFCKHRAYRGVFFDDIIIYFNTLEEHKSHLRAIFQELRENKLFINGKKSELFL